MFDENHNGYANNYDVLTRNNPIRTLEVVALPLDTKVDLLVNSLWYTYTAIRALIDSNIVINATYITHYRILYGT